MENANMVTSLTKLKLTPSHKKVIQAKQESSIYKLLLITESQGGDLILHVEKPEIRKTDKHEAPFKYYELLIGKRGTELLRRCGNIYDHEDNMLIDNFTVVRNPNCK